MSSSLRYTIFPAPSFSQLSIILSVGLRTHGLSPSSLAHLLVLSLFSSSLCNHFSETLNMYLLILLGDTTLHQTPWSSVSYNCSISSASMFPECLVMTILLLCSFGLGFQTLYFHCLMFSVVISICFKENFSWLRLKTTLTCVYNDKS